MLLYFCSMLLFGMCQIILPLDVRIQNN
uniref:Uncharacterized protein n=1 Tax=Anguilla anguilla TaxID=7936 RepID=A0A0E9Q8L1_ANGAN